MALALGTLAIVLVALLSVLALERLRRSSLLPALGALPARLTHRRSHALTGDYDPGRELRAEQRARALLRSCVGEEEWSMYRDLGFLRVQGKLAQDGCAYLLYPHKPILAYMPQSGLIVGEYCVDFPDHTRPYGSARLPDSDDVLAKWMALTADERGLIERANMHLPGRQIRVAKARRDLARLASWQRERSATHARASRCVGSVPAL
jgi:hypothetical protein